jgi:hypothetical protein
MNRRDCRGRAWPWAACLPLAALTLALAGCTNAQIRSQYPEEPEHEVKYDVQTVGDVMSSFANADPVPVGGVGLVTGLDGTGSAALRDGNRSRLEAELLKQGVRDVQKELASPDNSLVLVSALIPPGARKGDPIDVEVTLPEGSRTTSLRGGTLRACTLFNYESVRNLSARFPTSDRTLIGDRLARAEGPLLVGFGDGDDAAKLRRGRLWGGGRCLQDRPFFLVLNGDHQYARVASAVAERLNETFHGAPPGSPGDRLAVAKNKAVVLVNVPPQYRHNLPHFLRVVRLVPLREGMAARGDGKSSPPDGATPSALHATYRRRLEEDLLNPSRTVTAALRLEALGGGSVPALKAGLESEHPLVRFCSAEALAYLDSSAGGPALAQMVEQHPVLRAFSLTALASMDQAVSHIKLRDLLASANPETRYGAFRALRALDERDPAVQGELLNRSFWLHRVAPDSPPLVHLSGSRRPEVVLFGEEPVLVPPFEFLSGSDTKFTLTAGDKDEHCTVTAFSMRRGGRQTRQCSLNLEEVLRTLAELGGTYPEAVELVRQAHACQCVSCAVAVDQLPQAVSVQELARAGSADRDLLRQDGDILDARPDFGTTPTLYEKDAERSRLEAGADDGSAPRDRRPRAHGGAAQAGGDVE